MNYVLQLKGKYKNLVFLKIKDKIEVELFIESLYLTE